MVRFSLLAAAATAALCQDPARVFQQAPPPVDQALRARISRFYQLHVEGKYRQAEALVADDSKDFYYTSNKPKYLRFEIKNIEYSENYSKAKATMSCEMVITLPGFANKPMWVPVPSHWKLEGDEWYWYIDPKWLEETPFGRMKRGDEGAAGGLPGLDSGPSVDKVLAQVVADRQVLGLKAEEGAAGQVRIANRMPGTVRLRVPQANPPGLAVAIDRQELPANQAASLTIRVVDPGVLARQTMVDVTVEPLNKTISIRVDREASK